MDKLPKSMLKKGLKLVCLVCFCMSLFGVTSCLAGRRLSPTDTSGTTIEVSASPAPPSSTPIPPSGTATTLPGGTSAVTPEITAAPTITATPAPTAKPTPAATIAPTSSTTASGRIDLAEGFYAIPLDADIKARIIGMSYPADPANCKITFEELRYIHLLHYDFDGSVQEGELIVNRLVAEEVMEIFYALYKAAYPFTSIRLVDDFGQPADDTLSMEANNTSAFCYRYVTGTSTLSRHSYGAAIDINPLYNPYLDNGRVAPANGEPYVDRTLGLPGMIDHDDLCYRLFKANGWSWGGDWSGDKDYQHFSKNLGY